MKIKDIINIKTNRILFYPIATTLNTVGIFGFVVAVIFFSLLTLGFIIELAYGVLSFENQRSITINTPRPAGAIIIKIFNKYIIIYL